MASVSGTSFPQRRKAVTEFFYFGFDRWVMGFCISPGQLIHALAQLFSDWISRGLSVNPYLAQIETVLFGLLVSIESPPLEFVLSPPSSQA
jgi:hypothetical protein